MKEKTYKFFSHSEINRTISEVESQIFNRSGQRNTFVYLDKLRYLNLNTLKRLILKKGRINNDDSIAAFFPITVKSVLRLIINSLSRRAKFNSSADMIHIRNNLSLFYFKDSLRAKIFMESGIRNPESFHNECVIRRKVEKIGYINTPKILTENLEQAPNFFVDEIIFGKTINWDEPGGSKILQGVLEDMWRFYQSNGIVWRSLRDSGIDIQQLVGEFRSRYHPDLRTRPDVKLNRILSFADRHIPSSLIHGDFSLGNIIKTSAGNYLIDWELSRDDFIIKDLYKTLLNKWEVFGLLHNLMDSEIDHHFGNARGSALSLFEQFQLEHFFRFFGAKPPPAVLPPHIYSYPGN